MTNKQITASEMGKIGGAKKSAAKTRLRMQIVACMATFATHTVIYRRKRILTKRQAMKFRL